MMHEMLEKQYKGYKIVVSESEDGNVQWEVIGSEGYEAGEDGHNVWDMALYDAMAYVDAKVIDDNSWRV